MIDFIGANKALQYKEGPTIYPIQTISHTSILIMSLQEQCSSTRSNLRHYLKIASSGCRPPRNDGKAFQLPAEDVA